MTAFKMNEFPMVLEDLYHSGINGKNLLQWMLSAF